MIADDPREPVVPVAAVPVARLKAVIQLLYPQEMTPTAKRVLDQVIAEYDR